MLMTISELKEELEFLEFAMQTYQRPFGAIILMDLSKRKKDIDKEGAIAYPITGEDLKSALDEFKSSDLGKFHLEEDFQAPVLQVVLQVTQ